MARTAATPKKKAAKGAPARPAQKITPEKVAGLLRTVVEPELGADMVSLGYIDDIEVKDGKAVVKYHLTSPFSPFADMMGIEIRRTLLERGIPSKAFISDHNDMDRVNEYVNWFKIKLKP